MSTARTAVTAEPTNGSATIRARVLIGVEY